jgi:hypothetical protein
MLNFQDVPVPFVAGQKSTADQPLIAPPGLAVLTNGEFDDRSNIKATDGITAVALSFMTGETAISDTNPTLRRILAHKGEVLIEAWNGIYRQQVGGSFALANNIKNVVPSGQKALPRVQRCGVTALADGFPTPSSQWTGPPSRQLAGALGIDAASSANYTCLVWGEQYTGGVGSTGVQVVWQIRHQDDDALVGRGILGASGGILEEPRVIWNPSTSQFMVFAIADGEMSYAFIDPLQTQNVPTSVTTISSGSVFAFFDIAVSESPFDTFCISAVDNTIQETWHVVASLATPTVFSSPLSNAFAGQARPIANMFVSSSAGDLFHAFYSTSASATTLSWDNVRFDGGGTIGSGTGTTVLPINRPVCFKSVDEFTPNRVPVLLDCRDAATGEDAICGIRFNADTNAVVATSFKLVLPAYVCASTPVVAPGAAGSVSAQGLLLGTYYASLTQSVYQVFDIAASVNDILFGFSSTQTLATFSLARVFDAGPYVERYREPFTADPVGVARVCSPVLRSWESYAYDFWCAKYTPNITDVNSFSNNPSNVQRNTLRWDEDITSIEFADLLYMAGGTPICYDGQGVFEEGYAHAPEIRAFSAAGAGALSAGAYLLVYVYEWFDAQGNRWQSAPSRPQSWTSGAAGTYSATPRVLWGTLKDGVRLVPYRTAAAGTVFYRDGSTPLSDTSIRNNELLYVGPGSLNLAGTQSNNALPAVKSFAVHQNRLVAVGGEYGNGFFYSKERSLRYPAEFNRVSGFGLLPDSAGRGVTAASVDDKLVFFGELGLAVVFGSGPNGNWLQNGYSQPAFIQAAEGIRYDTPHVGLVPDGVWYLTDSGPRMLTRGLATARGEDGLDMGAEVRLANGGVLGRCTAVVVHPAKPQVLFYVASEGKLYLFDYQRNMWSRTDGPVAPVCRVSAVVTRGLVRLLDANDVASDPFSFIDPANVSPAKFELETGWMTLAGLQRYQRLTSIEILGVQGSKGTSSAYEVRLRVYTDFDPVTVTQDTVATTASVATARAGWQVKHQIQRQQSQAYKLRITITPLTNGGNFALVGMLVRVGTKKGGARLPNSRRA